MKKILPILILPVLVSNAAANAGPGPWASGAYYPGQLDGRYSANVYNNTQDRFDADEMDPPSGNSRYTNNFSSTTNTVFRTNISVSNVVSTVTTVTNIGLLSVTNRVTTTNAVETTNIVSASITNTDLISAGAANVVSGVLGFAIRNGTPSTSAGGSTSGGTGGSTGGATGGASGGSGATTGGTGSSGTVETIGLDSSHNYFVIYVNGDVFAGKTAAGINLDTKRVAGSLWNGVGGLTYQVVTNFSGSASGADVTVSERTEVLAVPNATAGGYFNAKVKDNKSPFVFKGAGAITVNSAVTVGAPSGTYPFNVDGIKSSENSISAYSSSGRNAP